MSDPNDRKKPSTISEYLVSMGESLNVYRWAYQNLMNETARKKMPGMIILLLVAHMFTLTLPFLVGNLVNHLIDRNMSDVWLTIGYIACVMTVGRGIFSYQFMRMREFILGEFIISLDERSNALFFEKSMGQHLKEHDELQASNVEKGRARVMELMSMMAFEGFDALISILIAFSFLFILAPVAGVIMLIALVVYMIWTIFLNLRVVEELLPLDAEFRALNRHRVERWEQIERVKTNAKETEERHVMDTWMQKNIEKDRNFWFWFIKHGNFRGFSHVLAMIAVLVYAAQSVHMGKMEIGMFIPLFVWSRMITDNMWRIGHIEHRMNWGMPSVRSMMEALTLAPDIVIPDDAVSITHVEPIGVRFQDVSYSYIQGKNGSTQRHPVLDRISFDVRPGEVVALLGKSGAGKSTIMRLLQRGMDPDHGRIIINSTDLKDVQLDTFLSQTGYIAQTPAVLSGSIKYNLLYGLPPELRDLVTDEQLWKLMEKLGIDFGSRLTDGLETKVGKNGVKLSGGEQQRLMIGAAVLKNPSLLIIDEATSSLDSTTEKYVQEGLRDILQDKMSALIIAHRLSTVRHVCDKFVVLRRIDDVTDDQGQVEAIGRSFEDLWEISPTFRNLARDQGIIIT